MEPWHYEPAQDLEQPLAERLRNFPREPDMLIYGARAAAALIIRGWLRLYHGLKIVGRENLPRDGSFVLVANHASHLDTLCLLAAGTHYPIVPCYLHRTHEAFPKGCWFPRPKRVQLLIGQPRTFAHVACNTAGAHQTSRDLRDAVVALAPGAPSPSASPEAKEIAS